MPRYIDADELLREISFYADRPTKSAMKTIREIARHPANVVEQKKAEWEICGSFDDLLRCSNCRFIMPMIAERFNFCPDCGADMRKDKTDGKIC